MYTVTIQPDFESWRTRARGLLEDRVRPDEILWSDAGSGQPELFADAAPADAASTSMRVRESTPIHVPKSFFSLAAAVSCHSDEQRWGLLYRLLWRVTVGGERQILIVATDSDVRKAAELAKEVQRDIHKMRAFVRFRKVGETAEGREQFVSWFEPTHHIVRRNAPFFQKRFTGMDWSILTPEECVHWDGKELHFTPGVKRGDAPDGDALEELWRGYYRSIFNPARLKLKAMQAEMPVKYWNNLPEAPLIHELTVEASQRRDRMVETEGRSPRPARKNLYLEEIEERYQAGLQGRLDRVGPEVVEAASTLEDLAAKAACCRACPLWQRATRTVFGEGNPDAEIMIIGEQPGDQEDLAGRPFVGPAGHLLDQALEKAGVDRSELYVTNAVKHFKWKPGQGSSRSGGARRLHDKATRGEMQACRPWLLGEIAKVNPQVILTLGNSAAQSLAGFGFRITKDRGDFSHRLEIPFRGRALATVHPSYLLRIREPGTRDEETARFFREVAEAVA